MCLVTRCESPSLSFLLLVCPLSLPGSSRWFSRTAHPAIPSLEQLRFFVLWPLGILTSSDSELCVSLRWVSGNGDGRECGSPRTQLPATAVSTGGSQREDQSAVFHFYYFFMETVLVSEVRMPSRNFVFVATRGEDAL